MAEPKRPTPPDPSLALATAAVGVLCQLVSSAFAQHDPGVGGGMQNTAGYLQYRGIPIPHPPVISPNPTTGATINANELGLFNEGVLRAGQLEATCDECADVPDGSQVVGLGELDPSFPQFHTNSNGLGSRHNADQCLLCHAQPTLGGSGTGGVTAVSSSGGGAGGGAGSGGGGGGGGASSTAISFTR